ncbi:MAG: hypothetical protein NT062_27475 [Proteobacteria bacterium]|nr:hypothetical protein [Pseudomonadota bacterium]
MLAETAARSLLVLHTVVGVAAVGAATHLVLWLRAYRRGAFGRHRAVRRFAVLAFALHAAGFLLGNLVYPTYRVEVRAAFLDSPTAIGLQHDAHEAELQRIAKMEGADVPQLAPLGETVTRAARAARWFDVKEHWIALGLFGSAALVMILLLWHPTRAEPAPTADAANLAIVPIVFWLAVVVAGTLWMAAIIGVMTSAWRAI